MINLILARLRAVTWKQWLLVGFFFLAAILIFGKCNTDKPVEKVIVTVPDKSVIKERDAYRDTVEYYRAEIEKSKVEKQSTEKLLKKADVQLKGLIVKYNQAVKEANVPVIRETCDSLVSENTQLFEQIATYQNDMNELIDYYELALKASDSAAIKSNFLLSSVTASNRVLVADYNSLVKSSNKNLAKAKRNRGLNRVLAGALVVVSGILIVK